MWQNSFKKKKNISEQTPLMQQKIKKIEHLILYFDHV